MFFDFGPLILLVLAIYLVAGACILALGSLMSAFLIVRTVRRSRVSQTMGKQKPRRRTPLKPLAGRAY